MFGNLVIDIVPKVLGLSDTRIVACNNRRRRLVGALLRFVLHAQFTTGQHFLLAVVVGETHRSLRVCGGLAMLEVGS